MVEDFSIQFSPFYLLGTSGAVYSCHPVYKVLVKYVAILNRAILWFISSKKIHINMCPKRLSFRNTDECSQMFDETVNCVRDIFLHKYAFLRVKSQSQSHKIKNRLLLDY